MIVMDFFATQPRKVEATQSDRNKKRALFYLGASCLLPKWEYAATKRHCE